DYFCQVWDSRTDLPLF
nr:immunoglobulin light chain junction region [Macaca mulatta]MOX22899.1 immunoglobulin light chain junction region [Macaca mulatta]